MAVEQEGIMSLPQGASDPAMQISLDDSYDAAFGGLEDASPVAAADTRQLIQSIVPMLDELNDEQLDAIIEVFQYMLDRPEDYSQALQEAIKIGILEPDTLPEEHDPELLSAILAVLMDARRQRQMGNQRAAGMTEMPMPPMQFARGGIAEAARLVASKGRHGDTMLAHINPEEARLLRSRGGSGTINPATGLPEYWNPFKAVEKLVSGVGKAVSGVVKSVGRAVSGVVKGVKNVLKSPVGRILATVALAAFLGPGAFGMQGLGLQASIGTAGVAALSSGVVTAAAGGNAKDILRGATMAYLGAPGGPVSNYVSGTIGAGAMGITNAAAASAINAGIVGTGVGLLSGQKLADAVKGGLISGALAGGMTGFQQGFGAKVPGARGFVPMPNGSTPETAAIGEGTAPTAPGQAPGATTAGPLAPVPAAAAPGARLDDYAFYGTQPSNIAPARVDDYAFYGGQPGQGVGSPFGPSSAVGMAPGQMNQVSLQRFGSGQPFPESTAAAAPSKPYLTVYGDTGTHTGTNVIPNSGAAPQPASGMFQNMYQGAKNLYNEYISPSAIQERGAAEALAKVQAQFGPNITMTDIANAPAGGALANAYKNALPGTFATYGPMTAAGLGIAGLMGGFSAKQPPPSAMAQSLRGTPGEDLIRANPSQYITQNLPGVQYDQSGNIIGSAPYAPSATMNDVRVATPGIPGATYQQPPMYQPAPIAQPYNMANMYSNLFMPYSGPRYMMDGGIASLAEGGYPRRTGQISGPGTEKSDSIPAMLSDGEFVMTAKAVRGAGNGSRRAGAKKMYALMHQLERNASRG